MRNTILLTGTLALLGLAGCAHEKPFDVTGVVPPSEMREEGRPNERTDGLSGSKTKPVVVRAPRRDMPVEPTVSAERPAKQKVVTFPDTPSQPEKAPAPRKITVTPENGLVGKVASVNASLHFVVLNFPVGRMAAIDQQLGLYRQGQKIGDVKITGPQQDDNIIADVLSGEAQPGDEVRDR